jgi:hypothetical protein
LKPEERLESWHSAGGCSGEEVHLEPGGMHIMLMQLRQPLEEGDR